LNKTKKLHFLLFFAATPHLRMESYGAVAALTKKYAALKYFFPFVFALRYGTAQYVALHRRM